MADEWLLSRVKRTLVGAPIPSHLAHHERFSRITGLAVLSSDALSSVAYATEEILRVLMIGGIAALGFVTPIGMVIAAMLAVLVFSYRQTIHAYPSGGGAYIVAKDNLGRMPSLIAAASLLIDYVLTVAVSIAAGVAAVTSAVPQWHLNRVEIALGFVALLSIGNLRGIRESGRIFAAPTYFFIVSILSLVAVGAWRYATGSIEPAVPPADAAVGQLGTLTTFMLLTAFSNGCTAMTGVEAVSNGVPAFRPPESRNAAATLVAMAGLAITMFLGITLLAHAYGIIPSESETVVSQLARATLGGRTLLYYAVQAATMLILVLAANTAYADFPRLASIVARDRFLPRQFMTQGDRLAFSNGILILSALAALLLVVFAGDTHELIPLYMIGVFVSFTLSQAGMVVHWRRLGGPGWRTSAAINGFGAIVTGVVLVIVGATKGAEGAWIIMIMIPLLVGLFVLTRQHYDEVAAELTLRGVTPDATPARHVVLVPIGGLQQAVVRALRYARTLAADVRAVYVEIDPKQTASLKEQWATWGAGVELVVLESPYRSLLEPLLEYVEGVQRDNDAYVTVVLPEFVPRHLWQHVLHNQHALLIKGSLLFKPNVVVTSVPFHLGRRAPVVAPVAGLGERPALSPEP